MNVTSKDGLLRTAAPETKGVKVKKSGEMELVLGILMVSGTGLQVNLSEFDR